MQQRVAVATYPTFELAHDAKVELIEQFPDNQYQIRKTKDRFKLVHRFKVNEIKSKEPTKPSQRTREKYKRRARPR